MSSVALCQLSTDSTVAFQSEVAGRDIVRPIKRQCGGEDEELELEEYSPGAPAIKLSLGLVRLRCPLLALFSHTFFLAQGKSVYEINGEIGHKEGEPDDLDAGLIWRYFGMGDVREEEMHV